MRFPRITRLPAAAGWVAIAVAVAVAGPANAAPYYRLESATTLTGGPPNWDYVSFDARQSYLYISRREEGLTVWDAGKKKVVSTISDSAHANASVLVPELDRGYSVNEDGTFTAFTLSSLKTIRRVKFADTADSGVWEPVTRQVVLTVGDSKQVVFLDPATDTVTGKVSVQGVKLEHPTPDGDGNLFLALRDKDLVVKIDARQRKLISSWQTGPCAEPNGVAFDRVRKRLFVGCRGKGLSPVLAVFNVESGTVVATVEIGRGNDGVVYDPESRRILTSNGVDGNLVVVEQLDADTYRLAEAATTRPNARTMAFDPRTKKVYLVAAEGTADFGKKVNRAVSPFYPNTYFADTLTVLTMSRN
jgi:DNA-binding beta-propeller fold protein YncE